MSCCDSFFLAAFPLLVALPDQDQAKSRHGCAIADPLQLVDHEARSRPGKRARALSDPEQAYGGRKQARDQQKSAHAFPPISLLLPCRGIDKVPRPRKLRARLAVALVRIQWLPGKSA